MPAGLKLCALKLATLSQLHHFVIPMQSQNWLKKKTQTQTNPRAQLLIFKISEAGMDGKVLTTAG